MKVLFLKHVLNVWKQWEIKEVKPWYAANFLFPQKLAVELTQEEEKKYKDKIKKEDCRRRKLIEGKYGIVSKLNWKKINFKLNAWINGKIYWWIWEKDIISEIKSKFKIELSKKHIDLPWWHIKKIWESDIFIKLWKDSMAKMMVVVEKPSSIPPLSERGK